MVQKIILLALLAVNIIIIDARVITDTSAIKSIENYDLSDATERILKKYPLIDG